MSRLLFRGDWFDAVPAPSLYEADYQAAILDHAETLYPDFVMAKFTELLYSEYGNARPDLALVSRDYREWWVVEVELGSHALRGDVERQVSVFATARYGEAEAAALARDASSLEREMLGTMMKGAPPRVLVLVNEPKPGWTAVLTRYDAIIGIVQLFRSATAGTILLVDGEHPSGVDDFVTLCRVDRHIPTILTVDSPATLGASNGDLIEIWTAEGQTFWRVSETETTCYLMPAGRYPLPEDRKRFRVGRGGDGRLHIGPR